jgi:hypothetical protein
VSRLVRPDGGLDRRLEHRQLGRPVPGEGLGDRDEVVVLGLGADGPAVVEHPLEPQQEDDDAVAPVQLELCPVVPDLEVLV